MLNAMGFLEKKQLEQHWLHTSEGNGMGPLGPILIRFKREEPPVSNKQHVHYSWKLRDSLYILLLQLNGFIN